MPDRKYDQMNIRNSSVLGRKNAGIDRLMKSMTGEEPAREIVEVAPENALVRQPDGTIIYKRFIMTPRGIEIPADCDGEEWKDVGCIIRDLDSSISWVIGDWAQYAMSTWEMTAAQIADMFGYETGTIETYAWVCRSVYGSIRNRASSFGHARLVASLDEEKQATWLTKAFDGKWTTAQLKAAMKPTPPLPTGGQLTLPGFGTEPIRARRKRENRLASWQDGKLSLSPAEALDEINGMIDYWTVQRESLIEQVSDHDNRPYQE